MARTKKIALVIGSNRTNRISGVITEWTLNEFHKSSTLEYGIIDLGEVNLPFLDEPFMPALGNYQHDHTKRWSETVSSYDGFFFIFPQYNWGYTAVLKNAVDFLYNEWKDKPSSFLTFGTRGGSQAALQWQTIMTGIHLNVLASHVEAKIVHEDLDEAWQLKDVVATLAPNAELIQTIAKEFEQALAE